MTSAVTEVRGAAGLVCASARRRRVPPADRHRIGGALPRRDDAAGSDVSRRALLPYGRRFGWFGGGGANVEVA